MKKLKPKKYQVLLVGDVCFESNDFNTAHEYERLTKKQWGEKLVSWREN